MADIDEIIATKIMGWVAHPKGLSHYVRLDLGCRFMQYNYGPLKFSPSRNIIDAWKVVERISTPGVGTLIDGLPWSTRFAYFFQKSDLWAFDSHGAALEISMMALKAAGIELESNAKDQTAGALPDREAE